MELLQQLLPVVDRGGHVVRKYIILPPFLSLSLRTQSLLLRRSLTPFSSLPLALSPFLFRVVRPSRPDDSRIRAYMYIRRDTIRRATCDGTQRSTKTIFSLSVFARTSCRERVIRDNDRKRRHSCSVSAKAVLGSHSQPVSVKYTTHPTRLESQLGLRASAVWCSKPPPSSKHRARQRTDHCRERTKTPEILRGDQ